MADLTLRKVERHKELCDKLNEVYAQKNKAYGDSFGRTYKELGIISAITRMSDKWNRIVNLARAKSVGEFIDVGDERLEDSLQDLANYCLMSILELKGDKDV